MLQNVIRAVKLDVDFYNTVEHDESMTGQAALLVAIVSALGGAGAWLFGDASLIRGVIIAVIGGLLAWLLWALITTFVGTKLFDGTADFGEMARVLGFAHAPLALGVLGWIGALVGGLWALVASVVAIREGLDFTLGKAIGTIIVGAVIRVIAGILLPGV